VPADEKIRTPFEKIRTPFEKKLALQVIFLYDGHSFRFSLHPDSRFCINMQFSERK